MYILFILGIGPLFNFSPYVENILIFVTFFQRLLFCGDCHPAGYSQGQDLHN